MLDRRHSRVHQNMPERTPRRAARMSVHFLRVQRQLVDCGYEHPRAGYVRFHSILPSHHSLAFIPPDCTHCPVYNIFVPLVCLAECLPRKQLFDVALTHSVNIARGDCKMTTVLTVLHNHACNHS